MPFCSIFEDALKWQENTLYQYLIQSINFSLHFGKPKKFCKDRFGIYDI